MLKPSIIIFLSLLNEIITLTFIYKSEPSLSVRVFIITGKI